jgi:hypothetical protein
VSNELVPLADEQEAVEPLAGDDERLTDARDDYDLRVWGVAWDVHVYLMGGLFCLLAAACVVNWLRRPGRVLSPLYFHACNGLLLVVGVLRAVFLLFDAYNLHNSYPAAMTPVLLNFAFPLLTLAFGLLFLFLVKFTRTQLLPEKSGRLTVAALSAAAILHVAACLGLQVLAGCLQQPQTKLLLLANQWLVLAWAVALALAYLAAFPMLSRALNTLNPMFSTTQHVPPASLGLVLRSLLAVAMLLLLLVCVHLYGLFGVSGLYGDEPPRPWPWWGFQFSVRVIEVSVCLLMAFVASLRVEPSGAASKKTGSVFALAKQRPMPAAPTAEAKEAPVDLLPGHLRRQLRRAEEAVRGPLPAAHPGAAQGDALPTGATASGGAGGRVRRASLLNAVRRGGLRAVSHLCRPRAAHGGGAAPVDDAHRRSAGGGATPPDAAAALGAAPQPLPPPVRLGLCVH